MTRQGGPRMAVGGRRHFLKVAGVLAWAATRSTGNEHGGASKPRAAFIGIGGRGADNFSALQDRIRPVAFTDADEARAAKIRREWGDVPFYQDYRRMLEERGDEADIVVVSTPDHTHACVALAAIRLGKHVYCEKPLAHSIAEVRALTRAARARGVRTQMGNQGHSFDTIRMFCEWVWNGAIGTVREIHAWSQVVHSRVKQLDRLAERHAPPATLDWNVWLGPAPFRPYHPLYLPGAWRAWRPFGCGTIGDWVCHVVDPVFWALDLVGPETVRAEVTDEFDPAKHADTFPAGCHVEFWFAATPKRPSVTLHWYDGTRPPPRPDDLEPGRELPHIGAYVVGDKGTILYGSHGAESLRIIPEEKMKTFTQPPKTLPRVKDHYQDWLDAIREGRPAGSDFAYGGPLTELALLGMIAQMFPGQKLAWDAAAGRIVNHSQADALTRPPTPREGWPLDLG